MAKGFHYGRTQLRHYTCEYHRIYAKSFKNLLEAELGKYIIPNEQLSKEHRVFNLIESKSWGRVAVFNIKGQDVSIPLKIDKRSASSKLFLICPYCLHQRQHIYVATNTYGCRKCLDLKYACQSERPAERLARRIRKSRKVIWGNDFDTGSLFDSSDWYPKPKWLRWKKFESEVDKIVILENRYWKLQEPFMAQFEKMEVGKIDL